MINDKTKKVRYTKAARVLAVVLTAIMIFTSVDIRSMAAGNPAPQATRAVMEAKRVEEAKKAAAPITKIIANSIEKSAQEKAIAKIALSDELEAEVQSAIVALDKAYKTKSAVDILAARKLVSKLSGTQLVRLYVLLYSDYYRAHYLDDNFVFFDVNAYLQTHPEISDSQLTKAQNREKALEHYLTYGVYMGYSSCTKFDPIVAIVVCPDAIAPVIADNYEPTIDTFKDIRTAYVRAEGSNVTTQYDLSSSFDDKGVKNPYKAGDGILFINKVFQAAAPNSTDEEEEVAEQVPQGNPTYYGGNGNSSSNNVAPQPQVVLTPINHNAPKNYISGVKFNDLQPSYADASTNKKYTMMIYMCGSSLESGRNKGMGTRDIMNLLASQYDLDNMNILLLVGGSNDWNCDYLSANDNDKLSVYYIDNSSVSAASKSKILGKDFSEADTLINSETLKFIGNIPNAVNMGNPEILLGFLDMAYDLYPADNYWLSLWNHGGGVAGGICYSDIYREEGKTVVDGTPLTLADIESALQSSKICRDEEVGGLSILSADACMMGGMELAYNLSPYVEYMLGSEEIAYDQLAFYKYIDAINTAIANAAPGDELDNKQIAVDAAKSYIDTHYNENVSVPATFAAYDLTSINQRVLKNAVNDFGSAMYELITDSTTRMEVYKIMRAVSARSTSIGEVNELANDYTDAYDFLNKLRTYLTAARDTAEQDGLSEDAGKYEAAIAAINSVMNADFIVYSGTNVNGVAGYDKYGSVYSIAETATSGYGVNNATYKNWYKNFISGVSLYLPFRVGSYISAGNVDKLEQYVNESVFTDYASFVNEYAKMEYDIDSDNDGYYRESRIASAVKKELESGSSHYTNVLESVKVTNLTLGNTAATAPVLVIDYKASYAPGYTFGTNGGEPNISQRDLIDPYTDFSQTVGKIVVDTTREISYGLGQKASVVIGSAEIVPSALVSSSVTTSGDGVVYDDTKTVVNLSVSGLYGYLIGGKNTTNSNVSDWATVSNVQTSSIVNALNSFVPGYVNSDITVFDGAYKIADGAYNTGYLVFDEADKGGRFIGTVYTTVDEEGNENFNYVTATDYVVEFYHYVVYNDGPDVVKECVETTTYDVAGVERNKYDGYVPTEFKVGPEITLKFEVADLTEAKYAADNGYQIEIVSNTLGESDDVTEVIDVYKDSTPIVAGPPIGGGGVGHSAKAAEETEQVANDEIIFVSLEDVSVPETEINGGADVQYANNNDSVNDDTVINVEDNTESEKTSEVTNSDSQNNETENAETLEAIETPENSEEEVVVEEVHAIEFPPLNVAEMTVYDEAQATTPEETPAYEDYSEAVSEPEYAIDDIPDYDIREEDAYVEDREDSVPEA